MVKCVETQEAVSVSEGQQSESKMVVPESPVKNRQDEADVNQNTEAAPLEVKLDEPQESVAVTTSSISSAQR